MLEKPREFDWELIKNDPEGIIAGLLRMAHPCRRIIVESGPDQFARGWWHEDQILHKATTEVAKDCKVVQELLPGQRMGYDDFGRTRIHVCTREMVSKVTGGKLKQYRSDVRGMRYIREEDVIDKSGFNIPIKEVSE
jgi:hypothetical protein